MSRGLHHYWHTDCQWFLQHPRVPRPFQRGGWRLFPRWLYHFWYLPLLLKAITRWWHVLHGTISTQENVTDRIPLSLKVGCLPYVRISLRKPTLFCCWLSCQTELLAPVTYVLLDRPHLESLSSSCPLPKLCCLRLISIPKWFHILTLIGQPLWH